MIRRRFIMLETLAAVTDGDGTFSIREIQVGGPGPDEVLVEIKASGICHTDYDSMSWGKMLIMGHEGAGNVLKAGSKVHSVKPGDSVLLNWAIPCGTCFQCNSGNTNICEVNSFCTGTSAGHAHPDATVCEHMPTSRSFHLGTMSRYTVVKEAAVVKMKSNMPYSSACLIGCGVMTGVGSAINSAAVKKGASCAIIGCGGVGLNVIQGCKIARAEMIIAVDISESSLRTAKEFGATHFIQSDKSDMDFIQVKKEVNALTGGRGADYAFECSAVPELGAAPLALVRNGGTAIQVSGIEQKISFDCELFEWNKIYLNPLYGNCNPQRDFPKIEQLWEDGLLKIDELISKTYRLEQLNEAFNDMHSGKISKGVIIFEDR
jgi:S-(hydroxymethyl)glutathione dehydrogenase/alcohol dehydrogenase